MAGHQNAHGAAAERTALAWTRTGLALLVAVALAARIAAERLGPGAVLFGLLVAPIPVAVLLLTRRRYRRSRAALHGGRAVLPDGRLPALVAVTVLLLGLLEIGYAVAG